MDCIYNDIVLPRRCRASVRLCWKRPRCLKFPHRDYSSAARSRIRDAFDCINPCMSICFGRLGPFHDPYYPIYLTQSTETRSLSTEIRVFYQGMGVDSRNFNLRFTALFVYGRCPVPPPQPHEEQPICEMLVHTHKGLVSEMTFRPHIHSSGVRSPTP